MSEADHIVSIKLENERLKRENEILLMTVAQIRKTVDRLIERYVLEERA
ncbi:hypothetical protein [Lachnoclostridium sp. An14]|nr:hypothetical protein [Lachnoclostridium sp. An14]